MVFVSHFHRTSRVCSKGLILGRTDEPWQALQDEGLVVRVVPSQKRSGVLCGGPSSTLGQGSANGRTLQLKKGGFDCRGSK